MPFFLPLYYPIGSRKKKPVRLTYDDISDSIGVRSPGSGDDSKVLIVRPQVRVDAPYLTFLKTIGAIA
jgi:hypothetical protein